MLKMLKKKTENLTLSRNQPRFGPEIIDKGGALTMTGRPMTCYQCLIDVPSNKKKERVRSRFCCVSCQKPVCLKKKTCSSRLRRMFPKLSYQLLINFIF